MIIGDKNQFAIEADIIPSAVGDQQRFVKGGFWMFGDRLANTEDEVSVLGLLISSLESLKKRIANQSSSDLATLLKLDPKEAFHLLSKILWNKNTQIRSESVCSIDVLAFFALPIGVEIMDGEEAYIIHGIENDLIIWKKWGSDDVKKDSLPKGVYESVIETSIRTLMRP